MTKELTLNHLRSAKAAHIKWVQKAKLLINGIEVQEDAIPVDSTDCKFGRWFYSDGQILNALSNNPLECMTKIERLHFNLHDTYMQIFNIYFNQEKKGFFSKIFGKKNVLTEDDIRKAQAYYSDLEITSTDLLDEINRLERRLIAIPEEKIKELM